MDSIRVDPHRVLPGIPELASGNPCPIIGIDLQVVRNNEVVFNILNARLEITQDNRLPCVQNQELIFSILNDVLFPKLEGGAVTVHPGLFLGTPAHT